MSDLLSPQDVIHDRYVVERALGTGSFATTYLCRDSEQDRDVAVKVMHLSDLDGWKSYELFEREARVLKSLDHHGIPDFYEVFRTEGDTPSFCLVQEYIEGRSLQDVLDDGDRMRPGELIQFALGVLSILDHLHQQSPPVYHRDIKPSNILIRPMGTPVLIDFGSVCDAWRSKDESGSTVAGTHGYMPPEQYMGKVGPTSDLYALGATLLHVITGSHPSDFPFEEGRVVVPQDIPGPPEIRMLVDRCLETSVSARPASARDAREMVLDFEPGPQASTALVPTSSSHALVVTGDEHPSFVDLGPAPRDPEGEFQDVYKMYVPSMWTFHNVSAALYKPGPVNELRPTTMILVLIMIMITFGIWIGLAVMYHGWRRANYGTLFRNGQFVQGTVMSGSGGSPQSGYVSVSYTYSVGDKAYRRKNLVDGDVLFAPGDLIGVLYDPEDPQTAVIAFR